MSPHVLATETAYEVEEDGEIITKRDYHIFDSETEFLHTASNMDVVLDTMISNWRTTTSECSTFQDIEDIHQGAVMTYNPVTKKQTIHQTRYICPVPDDGYILLQIQEQMKSLKTLALETLMKSSPGLFDRSEEDLKAIGFPYEVAQMIVEQRSWENVKAIHHLC
ncbi:MAG: hypothetical protein GY696_14170 [Gammaproteobacteria bacterium]|nr:hypothetical protein [Gammaproteobacteria bacterium]